MKHDTTAKRLKIAMSNLNINAQELSNKSGVAKASISQYVNGSHKPSNISSGKMASVLNVNPLWLMGFDVPMNKSEHITPHYESFDDVEYVKNLIQSLGYTAYIAASQRFGNSFVVQKNGDDKSVLIRNSEIRDILCQIEKAKADIVQQVIVEKYENEDYYVEPSETELLDKVFGTITDVNDAKEYLSLRNMDISSYSRTEKISDEAIIDIANIIASEEYRHSSDSDSSAPKAARNNYINEPGEVEKTYEDISSLKRPE